MNLDAHAGQIAHELGRAVGPDDFAVGTHAGSIGTFCAEIKHKLSVPAGAPCRHLRRMNIGKRIKAARQSAGWSQNRLGQAVNAAPTTISSWERGRTEPGREDVQRIADALDLQRADLELDDGEQWGGFSEDGPPPPIAPTGMPIRGEIRAGAWLEVDDTDQSEPETHPAAPDPRFPKAAQWLRRVRGDSMNALTKNGLPAGILDGDLVHIVDAIAIEYEPETGDVVEVERSRFDGAEREITLKQVEVLADGSCLLWPRSTSPRWQEPVPYTDGPDDGAVEVRVIGKMLQVLRQY